MENNRYDDPNSLCGGGRRMYLKIIELDKEKCPIHDYNLFTKEIAIELLKQYYTETGFWTDWEVFMELKRVICMLQYNKHVVPATNMMKAIDHCSREKVLKEAVISEHNEK